MEHEKTNRNPWADWYQAVARAATDGAARVVVEEPTELLGVIGDPPRVRLEVDPAAGRADVLLGTGDEKWLRVGAILADGSWQSARHVDAPVPVTH